jgi:hypothetical protein
MPGHPTHVIRDLETIDAELQFGGGFFAVRLGSAVGRCRR